MMRNNDRLINFAREISWAEKTTYFYPPWRYISNLDNISIESIERFNNLYLENDSVNLYFHFPLCPSRCPFCSYCTINAKDLKNKAKAGYVKSILNELHLWLSKIKEERKNFSINSIYIGGGTPSYWFNKKNCEDFFENLEIEIQKKIESFSFKESINEITFEIHPLYWTEDLLKYLKETFTDKLKLSIGIQSFSPQSVQIIRNLKSGKDNQQYIEKSKQLITWAIDNQIFLNIDFMWGLKNSPIEKEFEYIKHELSDKKKLIDQYTFYHIWRPSDFEREIEYRDLIEVDFEKIKPQRQYLLEELHSWGFSPDIYIEYFSKAALKQNRYNQDQMHDRDYIACGLNAHGKIGNLIYLNESNLVEYNKNVDLKRIPIKKFQFIDNTDNEKRKLLLSLRLPNKLFSEKDLKDKLFFDDNNLMDFFEKEDVNDCRFKLNKNGILNLTEIMFMSAINDLTQNKSWQIREHHEIVKNIESSFTVKDLVVDSIKKIINSVIFDYYKLLNCIANYRIEVLNIAYFSYLFNTPIFGFPHGSIDREEWLNLFKEWEKDTKKISLYEIFFKHIKDVGIPYPLKINGNQVIEKKEFIELLKRSNINLAQNGISESQYNHRIDSIWELFKLFLGKNAQCKFIYFIGIKATTYESGTGGIIVSTIEELEDEDILLMGNTLESFFNVINRSEYLNKINENSIKSAIASIMSRNMSHNIGSHILSSLGREGINAADDRILFQYLQHRMDYIAQISTEMPTWSASVWFISDLMKRFYLQTHLLEYIGKSEGLGAKHWNDNGDQGKIVIKIKDKNDPDGKYIISDKSGEVNFNLNDFQLAIPGGIVGLHAFYTILENIIRNAAKHNWEKDSPGNPGNLEITIEFDNNHEKEFVEFRIYDNVSLNQMLPGKMNEIFSTDFIDDSGKLNNKNWGLGEMRISAGYLNQKTYQEIGTHKIKDDTTFIKADDKAERLVYEFSIPKPKELVVIGDSDLQDHEDLLKKYSIYIEEKINNKPYEHEIVVIFDNVLEVDYSRLENLPGRVIIVKTKNESRDLIETISEKLGLNEAIVKKKITALEKSQYETFKEKLKFSRGSLENECNGFKINLYKKWVEHLFTGEKESFYLNLTQDRQNDSPDYLEEQMYRLIKNHSYRSKFLEDECQIDKARLEDVKNELKEKEFRIDKFIKGSQNLKSVSSLENQVIKRGLERKKSILENLIFRDECHIDTLPGRLRPLPEGIDSNRINWVNDFFELFPRSSNSPIEPRNQVQGKTASIYYGRHINVSDFKNDNTSTSKYVESLSGSQFYFTMLYDSLTSNADLHRNKNIILQMIENALLKYVIVDERAARFLASSDVLSEKFKFLKIEIPFCVQFNKKTILLVENLENNAKTLTETDLKGCDIFIIHQGILDKMGLSDEGEAAKFLGKIKEIVPFVLITSGRGKPHNTPDNVKLLPFSSLDSFLLKEYPEKILLTQSVLKLNLTKNGDTDGR